MYHSLSIHPTEGGCQITVAEGRHECRTSYSHLADVAPPQSVF